MHCGCLRRGRHASSRAGIEFVKPGLELTRATYQFRGMIDSSAVAVYAETADDADVLEVDQRGNRLQWRWHWRCALCASIWRSSKRAGTEALPRHKPRCKHSSQMRCSGTWVCTRKGDGRSSKKPDALLNRLPPLPPRQCGRVSSRSQMYRSFYAADLSLPEPVIPAVERIRVSFAEIK
jgi:hypothetical protein